MKLNRFKFNILKVSALTIFISISPSWAGAETSIENCASSASIAPVDRKSRISLEKLQSEFEIIKFCSSEISAESKKYNLSHMRTCLCASSEGVKQGARSAYTSAKFAISHPRDAAKAFYQTLTQLDSVAKNIWEQMLAQEWILPGGKTVHLTEAERTAVHCEVLGEFLIGGGISKSLSEVLIKQQLLKNFPSAKREQLKFKWSEEGALEKVNSKINSKVKFEVLAGQNEFANYRTVSLVDENGKTLGYGSFEYEPASAQLNVGSLFTEAEFQRKGVNDAVVARALAEYPKTKDIYISVFSGTNKEILLKKLGEGESLQIGIKETAAYKSFDKLGFGEIVNPHKLANKKDLYGVTFRKR
jgi:GNAT superfamily N-acetyltransferase